MGWEGSKRVFLQFLTLCVCQSWAGAAGYNPGLDSSPGGEEAPALESHQGTIRAQSLSQHQFFPLVSNTHGSSPVGWSQLWRVYAAGKLYLPQNPTRSLLGQHKLGALRYRHVCASTSPTTAPVTDDARPQTALRYKGEQKLSLNSQTGEARQHLWAGFDEIRACKGPSLEV